LEKIGRGNDLFMGGDIGRKAARVKSPGTDTEAQSLLAAWMLMLLPRQWHSWTERWG
jgi:hypothetical protein